MEIDLKLELNEVNAVLDAIGLLPTNTNTWPIAAKIRAQAKAQIPHEESPNTEGQPQQG